MSGTRVFVEAVHELVEAIFATETTTVRLSTQKFTSNLVAGVASFPTFANAWYHPSLLFYGGVCVPNRIQRLSAASPPLVAHVRGVGFHGDTREWAHYVQPGERSPRTGDACSLFGMTFR